MLEQKRHVLEGLTNEHSAALTQVWRQISALKSNDRLVLYEVNVLRCKNESVD